MLTLICGAKGSGKTSRIIDKANKDVNAAKGDCIYVSDTPCMREVYGDCAGYIDLADNAGDVDRVRPPRRDPAELLRRYSWQKSAQALWDLLKTL